jgi:quercetin dioxygenase-like cupin family protein
MSVVRAESVEALAVLGDRVRILLRSGDSAHRMAVMDVEVPPGGEVPPHRHRVEEEGYLVLDGRLEMTVGDETTSLGRGDFAHVPAGTVHGYRNGGTTPARFLAWTVGGAIDEFFTAMHREVRRMPDDLPRLQDVMARFGVEPVGPAMR